MTREFDDVTTPEEFQEMLCALVSSAVENDVEVEGGWVCESNPHRWDVVISSLQSNDAPE